MIELEGLSAPAALTVGGNRPQWSVSLRDALDDQRNFRPFANPKRERPAKSGPPLQLPDCFSLQPRGPIPEFLLCRGLFSLFCAAHVHRKVASNGLHQYWDECLNSEQVMTMAGITPAAADVSLPCGIGRTSQKQATADAGPLIAKVPRFGIPVAARCRRMRGSRGIGPLGAS